jgi:hypothetical protein
MLAKTEARSFDRRKWRGSSKRLTHETILAQPRSNSGTERWKEGMVGEVAKR